MEIIISMDRRIIFFIFFNFNFSNKQFNFKMNDLTYSGDGSINSENNIKNFYLKNIYFLFNFKFLIFLLLNITEVRMFNSLNLSMSISFDRWFFTTNSLNNIIKTNSQKIIFIISLLISMLNFFLIFNILKKK